MAESKKTNEEIPAPLDSSFIVPEEANGMRLDTWLSLQPGAPSRNRVQQLVKDGMVSHNGKKAKRSQDVRTGDMIEVEWPPAEDAWPRPENIPLDIVYDDEDIIVINKQANLVVHPSGGHPDGTMVNALLYLYPDLPGINGVKRPGLVHRIDRDTTGLMVVAKTEKAMTSLSKQIQKRYVHRAYWAVVNGNPSWNETVVEAEIGRDPINRIRRAINGPGARTARSFFKVLRRSHYFTQIECILETGRTHQIRVHCQHIGHSIIGDDTYGGHLNLTLGRLGAGLPEVRSALQQFNRPFLHAFRLEFRHPITGFAMGFEVPLPKDAAGVLSLMFPKENPDELAGRRAMITQEGVRELSAPE